MAYILHRHPQKLLQFRGFSVINRRIGSACENFAQWRRCGASGSSSGELQVHPSPGFDITRRVFTADDTR